MKIVNLETGTMEYPWEKKIPMETRHLSMWRRFKTFISFTRESIIDEDYYLFIPFEFQIKGINYSQVHIKLPKGSVVNGASVPKILRSLVSPNGVLYIGAIFHDFFYGSGKISIAIFEKGKITYLPLIQITQKEADALFFRINNYVTGMVCVPYIAYLQLRMFGWVIWNKCKKNRDFRRKY